MNRFTVNSYYGDSFDNVNDDPDIDIDMTTQAKENVNKFNELCKWLYDVDDLDLLKAFGSFLVELRKTQFPENYYVL